MNTQYRKNLKAVLEASKTYCDESINNLKWELGTYDLGVDTINGTTMLLPTPANTIQASMVRIDGASEVSENLIVLNDVAQTTTNGITYKVENGKVTLGGTATSAVSLYLAFTSDISIGTYSYNQFAKNTGHNVYLASAQLTSNTTLLITQNSTTPTATNITTEYVMKYLFIYIGNGNTITNYSFTPMLVKGTTAPSEFKVGYDGIHNLELSGLKVEGENLIGLQDVAQTTTNGITYSVKDGAITLNGTTSVNYWAINLSIPTIYAGTYYGTTFATSNPPNSAVYLGTTQSIYGNITTTTSYTNIRIYIHNINTVVNNWVIKPMLVRGSTAPTTFVQYVAPTTKTIDLSTILYNGSPLFEGNSLKGVDTIKDSITPYKSTKKLGYVDLGSFNYSYNSEYNFFYSTELENYKYSSDINALCGKYDFVSVVDSALAFNSASDKSFTFYINNSNPVKRLYIKDSAYNDTTAFKTAMSGVYLVYELATPIEVSIDFSQLVKFEAHSNGSITLVNTNNQDTTSTFKYLKEVAK